jgi:hypothetical protein
MALRIEHFPLQVALVSLYRPFRDELGLNHVCLYAPAVPQLGPFYGHLARWLTVNVQWCEVASLLPIDAVERNTVRAGPPRGGSTPKEGDRLSHPTKEKAVITARERADVCQLWVTLGDGRDRQRSLAHVCKVGAIPSADRRWLKRVCRGYSTLLRHTRASHCASRGWRRWLTSEPRHRGESAPHREHLW